MKRKSLAALVIACLMAFVMMFSVTSILAISEDSYDGAVTYVNLMPESEEEMEEFWVYTAGNAGENLEMEFDDGKWIITSPENCTWPWVKLEREFLLDSSKDVFLYYDIDVTEATKVEFHLTANSTPGTADDAPEDDATRFVQKLGKVGSNKGSVSMKKFFEDKELIEDNELFLNTFRVQVVASPNAVLTIKQLEIRCGTQEEADAFDPTKATPTPAPTTAEPTATTAPETEKPTPTIAPTTPKASATQNAATGTTTPGGTDGTDEGFPTWAIVVIVVVVAAAAGGLIYYFAVAKKKKQ